MSISQAISYLEDQMTGFSWIKRYQILYRAKKLHLDIWPRIRAIVVYPGYVLVVELLPDLYFVYKALGSLFIMVPGDLYGHHRTVLLPLGPIHPGTSALTDVFRLMIVFMELLRKGEHRLVFSYPRSNCGFQYYILNRYWLLYLVVFCDSTSSADQSIGAQPFVSCAGIN